MYLKLIRSYSFFFLLNNLPIVLENTFLSQNKSMHTFELLALELFTH